MVWEKYRGIVRKVSVKRSGLECEVWSFRLQKKSGGLDPSCKRLKG